MKKKILVTTAAFSLGLTSLGVTTTTFAAQNSPTTAQVQGQKQGVFPQTIGDKDG
ncbi:TPA: hypothetical protein QCX21_005644, partial [Bacillus toyonensis]|nr:hypothetical protein [Bacillus toyonensis]